jgi:hypothetical protein
MVGAKANQIRRVAIFLPHKLPDIQLTNVPRSRPWHPGL